MIHDILEEIKTRKNFYRDYYRLFSRSLYICFAIIILELALIIVLYAFQGTSSYYASSSDGGLTRIYTSPWGTKLKDPDPSLLVNENANQQG